MTHQLVTVTGPPGAGKTRLAVAGARHAAAEFPAGVRIAELGPLPGTFAQAVATALDVTERPAEPLAEALCTALRQGRSLLVLDHCDASPAEAASLATLLLAGCPELVILFTAENPLGLEGERVIEAHRDESPVPLAVALLAARKGADIFAATRSGALSDVLGATYGLLPVAEQRLLRAISLFCRGFDTEMAAALTAVPVHEASVGLDHLAALELLAERDGRWWLPRPVREFGLTRLTDSGEMAEAVARRQEWATATAAELVGLVEEGKPWRARFDRIADDLRAAVRAIPGPGPLAHTLARALAELLYARQFLVEARATFEQAAAVAPGERTAAADLRTAADVAMTEHRGEPALALLVEAARRSRLGGDPAGQAIALAYAVCVGNRFPATFTDLVPHERLCELMAEAEQAAAVTADPLTEAYLAAARAWNATGLKTTPDLALTKVALDAARATGEAVLVSGALDAVSSADGSAGRFADAYRACDERLRLFDRLPRHDPRIGVEIVDTLHVVPLVAISAGELPGAIRAAERSWEDELRGEYMRASKFVVPLMLSGRFDEAGKYAGIMWDAWNRVGRPSARWMAPAVHAAGLVHGLRARQAEYDDWLARAHTMSEAGVHSGLYESFAAFALPREALQRGAYREAVSAAVNLSTAPAWDQSPHQFYDAYAWAVAAEAAVLAGLPDGPAWLTAAAPAGRENAWAAACLARAHGRLHRDTAALRDAVERWERIGARHERACTLLLLPGARTEAESEFDALGCPLPPASL
ncbi:hypothetical protein [Amycolatopsis pigmentata]|uniref:LuxR family transcriptional regulator n=1 Tax=Amycolatopsis pigmentata TaxID=450801 RepID=A0ABW5G6S1_9PSEU